MGTRAGSLRIVPPGRRLAFVGLLLATALLAADRADAQHGFIPPPDRPLHQRLAEASVVAIATVAEVGVGRIRFESPVPILGRVGPEFELKRAPSNPPPWIVGDRALLLLAGARSPHRWIDRPVEAVTLADADAERRFVAALRALDAVRVDAIARRDLYASWADGPDADLAAVGQRGLMDVQGMAKVLDEAFALDRARVATDPSQPLAVRRRAARVAARHPAGVAALLDHLARTAPDTDPEIAEAALQSGLVVRDPAVGEALVRVLDAPESGLGPLVFRFAGLASDAEVERKLSELAVGHPSESVRTDAVQALKSLRRNRARRGG